VVQGAATPSLLETYEPERRPHAAALIRMALNIGAFMQPKSVAGAWAAQTALRLACLVPACRDYILQLRFKPKPRFDRGWFEPSAGQPWSELVPQPPVQHRDRGSLLLDELLGPGFAVVGWDSPAFRVHAARLLPAGMAGRVVALVRRDDDFLGPPPPSGIEQARDATGDLGALLDRSGAAAMLVRPDRYAACFVDPQRLALGSGLSLP